MNRLKCPFCDIPTIDDKPMNSDSSEEIQIEEYTCTECFIKHFLDD